jgi:hypothetical protein
VPVGCDGKHHETGKAFAPVFRRGCFGSEALHNEVGAFEKLEYGRIVEAADH